MRLLHSKQLYTFVSFNYVRLMSSDDFNYKSRGNLQILWLENSNYKHIFNERKKTTIAERRKDLAYK